VPAAGVEPALGSGLSRLPLPLGYAGELNWCAKQDSNLHCAPSEEAASCQLGYWR
jgi:hypothetical protein